MKPLDSLLRLPVSRSRIESSTKMSTLLHKRTGPRIGLVPLSPPYSCGVWKTSKSTKVAESQIESTPEDKTRTATILRDDCQLGHKIQLITSEVGETRDW